ncbi:MAG TPA: hypothetical protein VH044_04975 [Polyangiaceae bacterium]|nr:hypothetical protein [Polyangiaceae bacterium]
MIAGHFGLAAAVKSRAPRAPLWALMLATVWLDVLFVPLVVAHVETFAPLPGTRGGYGEALIHADYTHSLLGALIIAAAFGLVTAIPWGKGVGATLGAVVFSHWLLDLPMHHQDMPLLPGNAGDLPLLGFGLWSLPAASAILELALVVGGSLLYWRAARRVADEARPARTRLANVTAGAMLLTGVLTLALNVAGQ